MASSLGTTNPLIAGVGAFAVVVGGLTLYKRYGTTTSAPISASQTDAGITTPSIDAAEPTPEAAIRRITPQNLMNIELSRAIRMIGRSNDELLTEYGKEIFVPDDESINWWRFSEIDDSTYVVPFTLLIDRNHIVEIGFYSNDEGIVTRLVVMTGGPPADGVRYDVDTTIIDQADRKWQPGILERSVEHGLALRYSNAAMRIIATHRITSSQWRFDISPIKRIGALEGINTIGTGKYATANCDVVGRTPTHLGSGKFFTIGQSQQAALAAARRLAPDQPMDDGDMPNQLVLDAGVSGLTLAVQMSAGKVQSLVYFDRGEEPIGEQRREEFSACWNKRVALVEGVAYWQAGDERYRLSDTELHIAGVAQLQHVVQRLADGIGKPDINLADLESAEFIANTPDWPAMTDLYLDDQAVNVVAAETVIGFDGNPTRRAQLLQEIERALGPGTLIRNHAGAPILQFKTKRATIEVQPANASSMSIMIRMHETAER